MDYALVTLQKSEISMGFLDYFILKIWLVNHGLYCDLIYVEYIVTISNGRIIWEQELLFGWMI